MGKINKKIEVISHHSYLRFSRTLNKEQANSIFIAFYHSDKFDENGNEILGGDSQLTGDEIEDFFKAIGDELKQKFIKKLENDEIAFALLGRNDDYESYNYDKHKYDKAIKSINVENIDSIIFDRSGTTKAYSFVQQLQQPFFKDNDNPRTLKEIDSDCKKIRKVIQKWCKNHGIDTSELDKEKIKITYGYTNPETGEFIKFEKPLYDSQGLIREYVKLMENYHNSQMVKEVMTNDVHKQMQDAIQKRYEQAIANNEELTTDNPSQSESQKELQKTVNSSKKIVNLIKDDPNFKDKIESQNQHIKESEIYLNDNGNGKFDKVAIQLAGNCWLLGGINALISTEFGKEFLERNIIKDEEKHIFAVHLQEAENKNLPKPNGDGIYVFTEKEVLDIQNIDTGLASGEGDIVAFALAIELYLKESSGGNLSEGKEHFSEGNSDYRLFEIVTGLNKRNFESSNSGIQYKKAVDIGDSETRLSYFDEIYALAQNKNGASTIGTFDHIFSVVGVDGDCLLIQESNNMASYKDKFELIENSFPPTYKIPKELFEKTFISFSSISWGNSESTT